MSGFLLLFILGLPQAGHWQGNRSMVGFFSVFFLFFQLDSYLLTPPKFRVVRENIEKGTGRV